MDQPLDLTITNTKTPFTIEYLTSNNSNPKRKPVFYHQSLPLNSLENQPLTSNEHVVPSPSPTINPLEIVNGGHGIKNPLFDCATEALQIKYGRNKEMYSISFTHASSSSFFSHEFNGMSYKSFLMC
jgi:hypothetical protein